MQEQPLAFFPEVLHHDLPLASFLGSDWTMLNGREFADFPEFQQLLLTQHQRFRRALAEELLTYALGPHPRPRRPPPHRRTRPPKRRQQHPAANPQKHRPLPTSFAASDRARSTWASVSAAGPSSAAGTTIGNFSGPYYLDALAVWEVRNLGFGNRALVRQRSSEHRQACREYQQTRDQIAADVTAAYHQAALRLQEVEFAEQQIAAAADALPLNFNGIRGRELRPIEAQQAITALALAR